MQKNTQLLNIYPLIYNLFVLIISVYIFVLYCLVKLSFKTRIKSKY